LRLRIQPIMTTVSMLCAATTSELPNPLFSNASLPLPIFPTALFLILLRNPFSEKDIELSGVFCISIRNKDQSFPVRAEHGERIEPRMKADPLEAGPIFIDQVEIEFPAFGLMEVGGEDDLFSVRMKEWAEV
jgi:hypothetical protein